MRFRPQGTKGWKSERYGNTHTCVHWRCWVNEVPERMKVIVARSAGFCFGVQRAVSICEKAADEYDNCVTLGPIIHNEHVIRYLEKKGIGHTCDVSRVSP